MARTLLCIADTAILAARECALGHPGRTYFRKMAVGLLDEASLVMNRDPKQDFHAESLFLRHKVADLDGEDRSVSMFYLERAQEVAPDDADVPPKPASIEDAAPARFSKQSLRAAMDAMKVKEVVTGAAARFAKGQTTELVSTLTPLLLPDEDQEETTDNLDVLCLTQSEKQNALTVLAAAAKTEGPSCVVIQIKALKMVYDLDVTKHHSTLRHIAEALESTDRAHTKQALEVVEAMGLAAIAASVFEEHYTESALQPGVKKNKASRHAAASLEASALLISAIQRASKPKDLELIELHEKLHDRLADCRCCCGDFRKGVFLKASLVQLANCRNRITKARDQRHATEPTKKRTTKVTIANRSNDTSDKVKRKKKVDADDDGEFRRRVRRQRSSISSIEDEDRTPQDKADRKLLDRLDKLIIQLCYCVYGFTLDHPTRNCREEHGACGTTLHISNEMEAANLWLAIQPYAMANKESIPSAVIEEIRKKISDPPKTEQATLLEKYLSAGSDDLASIANFGEITEQDRQLARELISKPTADQVIVARQGGSTPKNGPSAPPTPVVTASTPTAADRALRTVQSAEAKILSFASFYKTFFQFCADMDFAALETLLEDEQTDYVELHALLESVASSTPTAQRSAVAAKSGEVTKLYKFDVEYNPTRPQSWIALADHLDYVKDIVLNDAAKILAVGTFRASPMLTMLQLTQLAIRRALIAAEEALTMTHYPGHPETEWVRSQIFERLGQTAYELVQDAPPIYDSRKFALVKTSPAYASTLALCKQAFTKASEADTENWIYPHYLAKVAKKGGQSLSHVLETHAKALSMKPGCLEAIYQVTNIRLHMLLSIEVSGRKKMTPESQAITLCVLKQPFIPEDMQNSWIGAYRDCIEALLFINKNYPKFHKASYRLAWARLKKCPGELGHCQKALEYLSPLFKTPRTGTFKVFMTEIDDTNLGIKTPVVTVDGNIAYECGISESRRRFIANVRRTLRLYLTLLYTNEDMGTLAAVVSYITDYSKTATKTRLPIIANSQDVRFFAFGLLLRALAARLSVVGRRIQESLQKVQASMLAGKEGANTEAGTPQAASVESNKLDVYLEQAYNVWFDFAIPARGNMLSWEQNVDEAFTQLEVEESRTDEGPDLVKEPYKTAFSSASKFTKSSPEMNFEQYALECVTDLEAKSDLNTLAARLSLCQNRFREIEPEADAQVKESGMKRLKTLGNALKDAFIRCSAPTIELLAKGEIKLCAGGLENAEEETAKKDNDGVVDEAKEGTEAVNSPQKSTPTNFTEIVLVTARRLHVATKTESAARVYEFGVQRRNSLQASDRCD